MTTFSLCLCLAIVALASCYALGGVWHLIKKASAKLRKPQPAQGWQPKKALRRPR